MNHLAEKSFTNIRRSAGSRGHADIRARGPSGAKFYIQAKSGSARPTRGEIRRLRAWAKKWHGAAAVIYKDGQSYRWRFYGGWTPKRRTLANKLLGLNKNRILDIIYAELNRFRDKRSSKEEKRKAAQDGD